MIAGVGALVVIIILFAVITHFKNRKAKKDITKAKLIAKSNMNPKQLQAAIRQRAAARSGNVAVPAPSAPPL
jgi:hypothetical protein